MGSKMRWFVIWAALLPMGLISASPASATRPGFNGAIAYVQDKAIFVDGVQLSQPGEAIDSSPAWSPDGRQLAFIRSSFRIYVMNADGSNLRALMDSSQAGGQGPQGYLSSLVWSSNGLDVTFLASPNNPGGPYTSWRVMVGLPNIVSGGAPHQGFERQRDILNAAEVFACPTNVPQICIRDGGVRTLDLTSELPEEIVLGTPPSLSSPQWQPTKITDRPRVLFAAAVYPDGNFPARREIFSINPHYRYNPATNTGTYVFDTKQLTFSALYRCGIDENGPIIPGALTPLTEYSKPIPSPDGKFFVARKFARTGAADCGGSGNLFLFDKNGAELGQVGDDASEPAWQPKFGQVVVNVVTISDEALDGAEVDIRREDGAAMPFLTTDKSLGGGYLFGGLQPGVHRVRVRLRNPAFEIHHGYPSAESAWVEKNVTFGGDQEEVKFRFEFSDTNAVASSFDNADLEFRLSGMGLIFRNVYQFVEWVKINVTPDTGARLPFYTFATTRYDGLPVDARAAFYNLDAGAVWMGTEESSFDRRTGGASDALAIAPENSEWHEFVHHLFPLDCPGEINHHGYQNDSTCDSLSEGAAVFLPAWANVGSDGRYAGIIDMEWHTKSWSSRISGKKPPFTIGNALYDSDEDFAVAALLWDIVDFAVDFEYTKVVSPADVHVLATYSDTVSVPLQTLWNLLISSNARTVYDLRRALDVLPAFSDLTVDLDNDGNMDVSAGDQLFLMHGFFPVQTDQTVVGNHNTWHYDFKAPAVQAGITGQQAIGLSSRNYFSVDGFVGFDLIPRYQVPVAPNANLLVAMRDASGTPLKDAQLELRISYPSSTQTLTQQVADGAGARVPFGLPTYFDYIPSGTGLPPCNPVTDLHVGVVARAIVNGYPAENTAAFDNCEYQQAVFAATGESALSIAFDFPEDSVPPEATWDLIPFGGLPASHRPNLIVGGIWVVKLTCDDPVVGDFATGCLPIEYRLDGGEWQTYDEEFDVREPGLHILEVRAQDRAGNVAAVETIELGIIAQFDPVPPITTLTAVPSVPPIDEYTAGVWHVTLACEDRNQTPEAIPSGCVTTEYSVDGAPFVAYPGAFDVTAPGDHTVAYRSIDLANNAETAKTSVLRIAGPDTTPPYTFVDTAFDGGAYVFDDGVMSASITFSLNLCTDGNGGPQQIHSGCATTEYALDGGSFLPFGAPVVVTQPGLHTFSWRSTDVVGNVEDLQSVSLTLVTPVDGDGDAVVDWYDNCLNLPNADQRNGDGDQFGDLCDPDFNGNGRVDSQDGSLLKSRLGSTEPWNAFLDLSGDGVVDAQDMAIIKVKFGKAPGPAGVAVFGGGN